jgi:8-oxo-dGTP diphosphatase
VVAIPEYVRRMRKHIGRELLMLPSVSAVVLNETGEVLLARRADNGQWDTISGIVDPGEQPADAVVREVYEEAGVHITVDQVAGVALHPFTYPNGDECHYYNVWFLCTAVGGEARVNDDESIEVRWFSADALPELAPFPRLRITKALRRDPAAWFLPPGATDPSLAF